MGGNATLYSKFVINYHRTYCFLLWILIYHCGVLYIIFYSLWLHISMSTSIFIIWILKISDYHYDFAIWCPRLSFSYRKSLCKYAKLQKLFNLPSILAQVLWRLTVCPVHLPLDPHIWVSESGLDNGLSTIRRQAIVWTKPLSDHCQLHP